MSIEEALTENPLAIVDLHSIGFFESDKTRDRTVSVILAHEQADMLEHKTIRKTGKSTQELQKEAQEILDAGFVANGEDLVRMDFIEVRPKPKLYIIKYKGSLKALNDWIFGVQDYAGPDGTLRTVSEPHLRTWGSGTTDASGRPLLSNDYESQLKYYRECGKFSEVVEVKTWEEFKKLR